MGIRVLVVDDEQSVLLIVTAVLENADFAVETAQSGAEALAKIREHAEQIDLVLTDVRMPGLDGIQLAEKVREAAPELPVVFMTGLRCFAPRDTPLIAKPFTARGLVNSVVAAALSRKAPAHQTLKPTARCA